MTLPPARRSHRFLLTFREEMSEEPDKDSVWRGWVVRVPEDAGQPAPPQTWFQSLGELPELLQDMIETHEQQQRSLRDDSARG